jgi:transcriptional regulator of acetoin/glycerol metabolism
MTDLGISQEQIRQLWNKYMSGGKVDGSGLRKIIFDSWERSRNNQVSFQPMKAPIIFQGESLDQHKNLLPGLYCYLLTRYAKPVRVRVG